MTEPSSAARVPTQPHHPLALLEAVDGVLWEARSPDMGFTFVSASSGVLLGHEPGAWLADAGFLARHLHPDDRDRTLAWWGALATSAGRHRIEYRLRDGRFRWLRHLAGVPESGAKMVRGVLYDVTGRRERQRQRQRAEQASLIAAVFKSEMQWVARITRAIEEDRLELWHQPIVSIAGPARPGRHFEILVRIRGEDGQIIVPGVFLPAAERCDVASRVDRWVLEHTRAWFDRHPLQVEGLSLCAINLSGQSLCEEDFLAFASHALESASLPARRICFEITETIAIRNLAAASRFIRVMKRLGCRFALDDFGRGVSSFACLKTLDVDFLKLDGMFVKDVDTDPVSLAMVRSINEVGHVMGKRTIAEFVETDAVFERLRSIGVDFAQGFAIGRPRPLDASLDDGVVTPLRRRGRRSR